MGGIGPRTGILSELSAMKFIELFYQGEGLGEMQHLEIEADASVAVLRARLVEKHGLSPDVLVFLEDEDEPIRDDMPLKECATEKGLKVDLHRLRQVKVTVTFNGKIVERLFSPGATIARVKRWAAEREFGMSEAEAGEHVLQFSGKHDRPAPGTHIGALSDVETRVLAFDLVPDERVNGASRSIA